ncbi:hypothetical protein PR202_ga07185 [Eleusine coracana subsp. coracana]|uniref:Isochorismatase-like domain-containing protein n=1 Tax=Eleusine coracana subsp. coracana TaxID=191504 RepID=A0AAV5C036_ELECO|nr:hypothetical protein PR202_ga07185 [Eleusine coracana subsp. coracana]
MPSHLALLSCLLVLVLSFDKFLLHYLKRRLFSGTGGGSVPRGPSKSRRPMAPAAAKWSETAMLVIDMQVRRFLVPVILSESVRIQFPLERKDFVDPAMRSPMLVADGAAVVPTVAEAVAVARERGIFLVWVVREHDPSGRDVELFRRHHYSGGKGPTVKGLKGAELADGLVIKEGEYKLVKTRFSAFFATHLDSVLKTAGVKNLVIVGVQTPNCIRQTAFDAVALDYEKVTVIIDATAAARPEIHLCEYSYHIQIKHKGHEEHRSENTNLTGMAPLGSRAHHSQQQIDIAGRMQQMQYFSPVLSFFASNFV